MSLHWLILVFATLFISSHMHSVQSQFNPPFRYGKWGFGACPKVPAMKDFDMTKFYGLQWYLIAHYSEGVPSDRHCSSFSVSDANPGTDICRVRFHRKSIEYDDGEHTASQYFVLIPNETDHATWIDTYDKFPIKTVTIDTDYDRYHLSHMCNEFPRDNPFIYEQHNYISSRQAVWKGGLKDFQEALDIFEGLGIDTSPFILHNQDDCTETPEIVPAHLNHLNLG